MQGNLSMAKHCNYQVEQNMKYHVTWPRYTYAISGKHTRKAETTTRQTNLSINKTKNCMQMLDNPTDKNRDMPREVPSVRSCAMFTKVQTLNTSFSGTTTRLQMIQSSHPMIYQTILLAQGAEEWRSVRTTCTHTCRQKQECKLPKHRMLAVTTIISMMTFEIPKAVERTR